MLTSVASKEDGIRRLYRYVTWPNGEFVKNAKDLFAALCEFVVFNECVKQPFHLIVKNRIEKRMGELYAHIANLQDKMPTSLTYKEAFMVFQILGKEQTQKVLDVEEVSSYAYNNILKSLEEHSYDIFEKALGEGDYSMLMKNLWMVRFILLGIRKQPKYTDDFEELLKKDQWQDGVDLSKFFNLLVDEDKFIEDRVNEFVQRCLTGDETIEVGLETHTYDIVGGYSVIHYVDKNRQSYKDLNDTDKEKYIEKIYGITSISDGAYYPAWLDTFHQKYQTGHDIDRLVRNYDSESANRNIDLTVYSIIGNLLFCQRDDIAKHFNVEVGNIFVTDRDTISWDGWERDIADLGKYIIYYTALMLEVYGCVKDVLYKEDRVVLEWLLGCSKYTEGVKYLLNEVYSNKKQSVDETTDIVGSEVSVIDTNPLYPTFLRFGGRLHNEFLQGLICKKYLPQWFNNKTNDPLYIKYVFFGSGIEPKEKMVFTGSKTELTIFVLFLSKGYGKSEIWSYFNQYIVDKNGKPVFAKNARSNVKENLLDAEDRMRQVLMEMAGNNKLSKEIFEDLK